MPNRRRAPNRPTLQLVTPRVDADTLTRLERLLSDAKRPELVGIAYVAVYRTGYEVDVVGQARRQPTLTRAMLHDLHDLLRHLRDQARQT